VIIHQTVPSANLSVQSAEVDRSTPYVPLGLLHALAADYGSGWCLRLRYPVPNIVHFDGAFYLYPPQYLVHSVWRCPCRTILLRLNVASVKSRGHPLVEMTPMTHQRASSCRRIYTRDADFDCRQWHCGLLYLSKKATAQILVINLLIDKFWGPTGHAPGFVRQLN